MQLSYESYRVRWIVLVLTWAVAAFALFRQAYLMDAYLTTVGQLGLRGAPVAQTPLKRAYPAFAADAQTWVRHALALTEGNDIRLRYTTIDNAPYGREVHWNSAWAWSIAGAGWIYHLFSGQPLPISVERATIWLTPTVLLLLLAVLSAWATRRAGVIAGVLVATAMFANDRIFEGFFPAYVDHHGLLTVSVFGMVLGAVFMGGGWWQPKSDPVFALLPVSPALARSAATFSAICGALGLWVSAASVIPPIAIVGAAGVFVILVQGRAAQKQGATFDPEIWRQWGRVGATASLVFYLLEYFPNHLAFRLEANHPLHALAWLGGGELIAQLGAYWLQPRETRSIDARRLAAAAFAVAASPLTIAIGGQQVFIVLDPFLSRLHHDYIQEFLPIWRTVQNFNGKMIFQTLVVDSMPLFAAIATLTYRRRESPVVLWFATAAALLFNIMAWGQSRWLLNASGAQVSLALVVLATWTTSFTPMARWAVAIAIIGALYVPTAVMRALGAAEDVAMKRVSPSDALAALSRDVATVLRASQPEGDIVLLTSPNASTSVGYYGRFKTLGTLYWENRDGLKSAGAILSAGSERQAATLLRAHGVTHIAIISQENFIEQYYRLLHPKATANEIRKCFGFRLFVDKVVPQWLEMIPYSVPEDLKSLNMAVMLFKVNFKQTLAEAIYNVALAQIGTGDVDAAGRTLDILLTRAPQLYQPWLRKGELLLARHNWTEAQQSLLKGIALAPPHERPTLYLSTAGAFYKQNQHALAIEIYRAALAERRFPEAACFLAWVLATSQNDALRNGKEALALAQEALKADPHSATFLNSYAAALAENGRFAEAVEAADRALVNAKLRGETVLVAETEQRIAQFRQRQPVRK